MNEESLFHEALALTNPRERSNFLDRACAGKPELHAAVVALLEAHADSGSLLKPPAEASVHTVDHVGSSVVSDPSSRSTTDHPAQIGRYAIVQLLGRGGMGAVYLAHDPELDRRVALKVPRLAGPDAEERFLREARAAAAVTHPNLCPVHEVGRADGVPYLTMAYIAGPTLTDVLKKEGPLPPARAASLAARVAGAMAEAHRHGIVHRDLKPGNILLDRRGEPVVTDFGLALRETVPDLATASAVAASPNDRLTHIGALMGTPSYMPPEQARGDLARIGPASDVYALGVILFELLTGRTPFRADSVAELVRKIETEPAPPPSSLRAGLSPQWDAVCARALAKEPTARYPSMEVFAQRLAPFAVPRRLWGVRIALAAAAALFLLFIGVILYLKTDYGTVEVRLNDPAANVEVRVDGNEIQLSDNGRITKLRAGPHKLFVKGWEFETETTEFALTRGEKKIVEVTLKPRALTSTPAKSDLAPRVREQLAGLLTRGRQLVRQARFGDLGAIADEALRLDPQSPGALALRATFRAAANDRVRARADAEAALQLHPETTRALCVRAHLNAEEGNCEEAIADLTIALRLDPTDAVAWADRARSFQRRGEHRQALADWARAKELDGTLGDDRRPALPDLPPPARKQLTPAEAMAFAEALAAVERAFRSNRETEWKSAVEEAVRLDPTSGPARTWLALGHALADRPAEAIKEATEALRLEPEQSQAYYARALAKAARDDSAGAVADLVVALRIAPTNAFSWSTRALVFMLRRQYHQALADSSEAIRLGNAPDAYARRGECYLHLGEYAMALADFVKASNLQPTNVRWLLTSAAVRVKLGDPDGARRDREKALRIDPQAKEAADTVLPMPAAPVKKDPE